MALLSFCVGDGLLSKASSISMLRALSCARVSPILLSIEDTAVLLCQGLFIYSGE